MGGGGANNHFTSDPQGLSFLEKDLCYYHTHTLVCCCKWDKTVYTTENMNKPPLQTVCEHQPLWVNLCPPQPSSDPQEQTSVFSSLEQ